MIDDTRPRLTTPVWQKRITKYRLLGAATMALATFVAMVFISAGVNQAADAWGYAITVAVFGGIASAVIIVRKMWKEDGDLSTVILTVICTVAGGIVGGFVTFLLASLWITAEMPRWASLLVVAAPVGWGVAYAIAPLSSKKLGFRKGAAFTLFLVEAVLLATILIKGLVVPFIGWFMAMVPTIV